MITETKRMMVRGKLIERHEIGNVPWARIEKEAFGKVTNTLSNFSYKKTGMTDENLLKIMKVLGMSTADINDRAKVEEEKNVVEDPVLKEMKESAEKKESEEKKTTVEEEKKPEKHRMSLTLPDVLYREYAGIAMAANVEIHDMLVDAAAEYMERILFAMREVLDK